jgi:GTP-binding protein
VVAVNKWDLIAIEGDRKEFLHEFLDRIRSELFFLDYAPVLLVSAKTGDNMTRLFHTIEEVRHCSRKRITTGVLNRLMHDLISANPPPIRSGRRFKLLYATQLDTGFEAIPTPHFILFVNSAELLAPAYKKYLEGRIRQESPFTGLPVITGGRRGRGSGGGSVTANFQIGLQLRDALSQRKLPSEPQHDPTAIP